MHLLYTSQGSLKLTGIFIPRLRLPFSRLYWSEVGYQPSIQSANMDGSNSSTLVSEQLEWPSGLALDFTTSRLFFCDTKTHRVDSVLLHSDSERHVVSYVSWPSAIAVHGDYLFVTSSKAGKLYKIHKFGRTSPVVLLEGLRRPLGIQVQQEQQQPLPQSETCSISILGVFVFTIVLVYNLCFN